MTPEERIQDLQRQLEEGARILADIEAKRKALQDFMEWARSHDGELRYWLAKVVSAKNN